MKSSISFVCQQCGYESPAYLGKCPECGSWNSLKEFKPSRGAGSRFARQNSNIDLKPKNLDEISFNIKDRLKTGFSEMDTVLGGGIVGGSVILLAGDPGIGKSTLLLQGAINIAEGRSVLYISGEESEEQIKLRSQRLFGPSSREAGKRKINNLLLLSATDTDAICEIIVNTKPGLVVIDSIQTIESGNLEGLAGAVGQVRYAAFSFLKIAKEFNIPVILVGHVTKEGMVAGPMVLSHMVDVVLFLEGEKNTGVRILRSFKNRFGPVDEVGIFAMDGMGLKEVNNPEEMFLGQREKNVPGSALVSTMEGSRAFLVEIQALVVFSKLPIPRRVSLGIDAKRLELLIAVLQKHCQVPLDSMDVFVNVAGGLKLSDRAADLGICLALFSSFKNVSLNNSISISEIGLLGELRGAPFLEKRIKEAKKLGFKNIISNNSHKKLNDVLRSI